MEIEIAYKPYEDMFIVILFNYFSKYLCKRLGEGEGAKIDKFN